MSDRRHTQRPALPEGYQFGDAHGFGYVMFPPAMVEAMLSEPEMSRPFVAGETVDRWRAPHENDAAQLKRRQADASRCPQCGQPANLMASRQTVVTDAQTGRTSAVIERNSYCPSAFHFDAAQRTGDETV